MREYLKNVIPETRRAHKIIYLRYYSHQYNFRHTKNNLFEKEKSTYVEMFFFNKHDSDRQKE